MPRPFNAIPGPKGWPLIGSLIDYSRFGRYSFERMHVAKRENYALYGKIFKEKMVVDIVHLFDPTDIETVYRAEGKYPVRPAPPLVVMASKRDKEPLGIASLNGEPWWRVRQAVQQTMMSPGAALVYLPIQNQVANDFVRLLSRKLDEGSGQLNEDITTLLSKYTMEAFGAVCFNVRIGCLEPFLASDSEAYHVIQGVNDIFEAVQKTNFSFPLYAIYRTRLYRQFLSGMRTCQRTAQTYIDEFLRSDEVEVDGKKVKATNFLRTLIENNSERLTNEEMVQLTIDLFTAGIDSSAYALSFCLYNLAANIDKQNRLLSELDSVLGRTSCPPVTPDVLKRVQYLKACVKESFRLNFPVEGGTVRELGTDLVLSDYLVPKGTFVSLNFQTMCLLEEYFEQADRYLPERWLNDECSTLRPVPSFVMLPFSYGSRMCIGRRFAEQEIYLALIKILHRFRLELDEEASGGRPLGMINRIFTMPDSKVPIKFIPR